MESMFQSDVEPTSAKHGDGQQRSRSGMMKVKKRENRQ
jgi:hypothetical protein